ncbi:MAG: FkbH domain-containing protein, partial [archaeon]
ICSKNDDSAAREPFEKHPEMVLRMSDFVVFYANWSNKCDNILLIKEALNIGLDSIVFIDDNPFERNMVRTILPDVTVPEMPEDPVDWIPYLSDLNLFEVASVSEEDFNRTKLYQAEALRHHEQACHPTEAEFLCSLKMKANIEPFTEFNIPRISQLTQRSNQFNLRTIRYDERAIAKVASDSAYLSFAVTLSDKFGSHGLVSVVVLEKRSSKEIFVDTWLMSCRVLKRGLERTVLNQIVALAGKHGYEYVSAEYVPTNKNALVRSLLSDLGFQKNDNEWRLKIDGFEPLSTFIQVNT